MATPPREGPPFLLPVDSRFRGNDGGERSGVCPKPQSTTVPADSVSAFQQGNFGSWKRTAAQQNAPSSRRGVRTRVGCSQRGKPADTSWNADVLTSLPLLGCVLRGRLLLLALFRRQRAWRLRRGPRRVARRCRRLL